MTKLSAKQRRRVAGRSLPTLANAITVAAPIAYWAPFFVASLVPGTGIEDEPDPVPRLAGVPTNLLGAAATTATAVAGWLRDRRAAA